MEVQEKTRMAIIFVETGRSRHITETDRQPNNEE